MSLKYLLDENLHPIYKRQLIESNPNLVVWKIGEPNSHPLSTLDPEILCW
ncbi:conserved hypothetical protein [Kamptonema sp. PCC 6506]|nr:conserved hypothetical protein [Kamptonema sp. PCC 6506]